MNNWLFVSVLLILGTIWHWFHVSKQRAPRKIRVREPEKSFHGVSVHPCSHPCQSVRNIKRVRFLSRETPKLPIEGCTNQNCMCTYVHHKDRRNGDERRFMGSFPDHERRVNAERRHQGFA